ncbi:eukaryotic type KH-domain (KH-domain type I) [Obba rivulosa]|uniref:Pre-rRNA-processing protein PNO1 n=1 Tax=Obba rivulosa TaxID=1052685 RepID=A0A8E2AMI5_9APHY|nr:eukaryotic type KH-domain (KH-domain type I) [Obba rivulosa]
MVVAHAQPAAVPIKKNRRKISKKKSNAPGTSEQHDETMNPEPLEPSTSTTAGYAEDTEHDDEIMIDDDPSSLPAQSAAPVFQPLPASAQRATLKSETRRIPIPPHRMTPLKKDWVNIFSPLTEMLQLQVRMNVQRRSVEIRTSKHTSDIGALQKGADFVKSYALGFDVQDAIALLRLDDLYLDSFEIKDVKTLHGDHLSRAIGRIAGQDGKTKFTIENASRTRIVLADTKIHILGSFQNIKIARDAIVSLILGSPPGKVYAGLRTVSSRMRQRAM